MVKNKIAILIDAENVDPTYADQIFSYADTLGDATVREIFGAGIALNEWVEPIMEYDKKRIREALLDCLVTGSLDKVTVKKIYEIADINRTTFYAHYYDPYILYEQIEKEVIDGLTLFLANFQDRTMDYEKLLECILLYFFGIQQRNSDVNKNKRRIISQGIY